ncbi:TIGR00341 family protein [Rhodohalobacter mucosus]|uniref:TIGR00341 family protein n=1 Tax=Rhodohalobacter mucosus TaxID=2079485 RepID=A0A316U0P0_9BACT|nr:TIGR00341 family protein [Rhodohalobacter mucosus]PWN06286.1 TIGR00341 family protein [Rhodohalobacter mucosus]
MALRLIQILPPPDFKDHESLIDHDAVVDSWIEHEEQGRTTINMLADVELTENILNELDQQFTTEEDYRIILLPVSATLPSHVPDDEEDEEEDDGQGKRTMPGTKGDEKEKEEDKRVKRISREELYEEIKKVVDSSWVYMLLIALSVVVAANGLIRNSAAMVIGAMVIAPILGPNVGLSLATTLGDKSLLKRSLKSIFYGFSLTLLLSVLMGLAIEFDETVYEIASRTQVSFADIALGLAAGVAGCLSFTRGVSAAVIGVMVAVALLPPLVATGLLLGSGQIELAMRAGLLTVTYIICVNLAGVLTFFLQGIKPQSFIKQKEGEELSIYAIIVWAGMLIVLALIIYYEFM